METSNCHIFLLDDILLHHIFPIIDMYTFSKRIDLTCKRWHKLLRKSINLFSLQKQTQQHPSIHNEEVVHLFPFLASFTKLQTLRLTHCDINGKLHLLAPLKNLHTLDLSNSRLKFEDITSIGQDFKNLLWLSLSHCKMDESMLSMEILLQLFESVLGIFSPFSAKINEIHLEGFKGPISKIVLQTIICGCFDEEENTAIILFCMSVTGSLSEVEDLSDLMWILFPQICSLFDDISKMKEVLLALELEKIEESDDESDEEEESEEDEEDGYSLFHTLRVFENSKHVNVIKTLKDGNNSWQLTGRKMKR